MTVVACNLKEMAADQLVTAGPDYWFATKLHRLPDGTICGVAGDNGADLVVEWLKQGGDPDKAPDVAEKDFYVLHLTRSGLELYVCATIPEKLNAQFHAVGTGGKVAMYVLKHGASPAEACAAACEVNLTTCGGPIDVMRLE